MSFKSFVKKVEKNRSKKKQDGTIEKKRSAKSFLDKLNSVLIFLLFAVPLIFFGFSTEGYDTAPDGVLLKHAEFIYYLTIFLFGASLFNRSLQGIVKKEIKLPLLKKKLSGPRAYLICSLLMALALAILFLAGINIKTWILNS